MNHHLVTGTLHSLAEILSITIVYLLRDSRLVIVINTLILIVCSGDYLPKYNGASLVSHVTMLRRSKNKVLRYIVRTYLAQHYYEPVIVAERLCLVEIY